MEFARFDDFFFSICNETGGIEGLLNALFSFLIRRTDFFYESDPGDKMGFPPGHALSLLASNFQKYQKQHYEKYPAKSREEYEKKLAEFKKKEVSSQQQKVEQEKPKEVKVEQKQKQEQKPAKPINDTYNGGATEKYSWGQTGNDVTVQIDLPVGTTKKELQVNIASTNLQVKVRSEDYINGKLYDRVKCEDSTWSIEDGKRLVIHLEKGTDNIWKTVIIGDKEIDATKVENSKALDEFDPETQGALRKIMFEQQRKMQGLPTTDEEKQLDMLKQAWNAEGSPFKGQPFDPSKFNLSGAGGNNFNMG